MTLDFWLSCFQVLWLGTRPPCPVSCDDEDQTEDSVCAKQTLDQPSCTPSPEGLSLLCVCLLLSQDLPLEGMMAYSIARLAWKLGQFSCLILPRAQITSMHHHDELFLFFLKVSTASDVYIQAWWLPHKFCLLLAHQLFPLTFPLSCSPDWLWISPGTILLLWCISYFSCCYDEITDRHHLNLKAFPQWSTSSSEAPPSKGSLTFSNSTTSRAPSVQMHKPKGHFTFKLQLLIDDCVSPWLIL